jgi:hypothetical protein
MHGQWSLRLPLWARSGSSTTPAHSSWSALGIKIIFPQDGVSSISLLRLLLSPSTAAFCTLGITSHRAPRVASTLQWGYTGSDGICEVESSSTRSFYGDLHTPTLIS